MRKILNRLEKGYERLIARRDAVEEPGSSLYMDTSRLSNAVSNSPGWRQYCLGKEGFSIRCVSVIVSQMRTPFVRRALTIEGQRVLSR